MRKDLVIRLCILFIAYFLCPLVFSQEIKFKVLNTNGNPVENADVIILGEHKVLRTDENGECRVEMIDKKAISLRIVHPSYYEKEMTVSNIENYGEIEIVLVPFVRQKEEIIITATRYPEPSIKIPSAHNVLTKDILEEKAASTIEQALTSVSGISSIGSGGYSKVPAIRGVARKRILILVENARIFSDRRTGPNASFVDPEEIEKIEIIKSPSSVQYGSEAMGGVIQIFTKDFPEKGIQGRLSLKYGFNGEEKKGGFQIGRKFGKNGIFFSLNAVDSEDLSSPQGKIPMSHYSRYNSFLRLGHKSDKRDIAFGFLISRGRNIGKPTLDSLSSPTYYPRENHNLIFLNWKEKIKEGVELSVHFSLNPNFLETNAEKFNEYKISETFARTESTDKSFQISLRKDLFNKMKLTFGLDSFLRSNCNAKNTYRNFSSIGELVSVTEEQSIKNGSMANAGLFLTIDYWGLKPFDLVAGLRGDTFFLRSEIPEPIKNKITENALTGFLGLSIEVKRNIFLFSNISTAYRVPDLSERFYTGITGRGFIIGNPDLKSERSLNMDLGVKIAKDNLYWGFYLFNYSMKDLVERYRKEGKLYSYQNMDKGYLRGMETEIEYYPFQGLKFYANFNLCEGKSTLKNIPLNDVPPPNILLGSKIWKGKFWGDFSCYMQKKLEKPGPSEIPIAGFSVFNFHFGYYDGARRFFIKIDNIFNKSYKPRPDPDAREEPGRAISFNFVHEF